MLQLISRKKTKIAFAYIIGICCLFAAKYLDHSKLLEEIILTGHFFRFRNDFAAFFINLLVIFGLYLVGILYPIFLTYFLITKKR